MDIFSTCQSTIGRISHRIYYTPISNTFLDLKKTSLNLKFKLKKIDDNDMDDESRQDDPVGLVNAPLYILFSQVDLNVQQQM